VENSQDLEKNIDIYKLADLWSSLSAEERDNYLEVLPRDQLSALFIELDTHDQKQLLISVPISTKKKWVKILDPDDLADILREVSDEDKEEMLSFLSDSAKREVNALLAYAEDEAGGLMNPRFNRIRPDLLVQEALSYMKAQLKMQSDPIYYGYVLSKENFLLGVVSLRQLFIASPTASIEEVMVDKVVTIPVDMDQEEVSKIFFRYDFVALPVVDNAGKMIGIITGDDVKEVAQEEISEDFHKLGGMESTDKPYFQITIMEMLRMRFGWLLILFLSETATSYVLGYFEHNLQKAMFLAFFIPLIVSTGGNSGSQISTLIIRAMALGEVRLRDWWRVFMKECRTGLVLGLLLGAVGFLKIWLLPGPAANQNVEIVGISSVVGLSILGVVLWGTIIGSMLPFVLRFSGFDPASASTPFVATLVDVIGLLVYFTVAGAILF
jgi:magnesium transporter